MKKLLLPNPQTINIPIAVCFWAYALTLNTPYSFGSSYVDRTLFFIAGVLLIHAVFRPTRTVRLLALGVCLVCTLGRIAVLLTFDSPLSQDRIIAGVVVWTLVSVLLVTVAVLTELLYQTEVRAEIREAFPDAEW